ncbi:hypothetical protein GCM10025868_12360 [Angustibacter aerolatus]|uniref:Uncharacterized protein n=1 Tax=Angustibacter aerolatus TaxID=1162965 RepID=A0ABQ6JGT9_9ACTN|nr:hypothetical protein GCM10025868_12360 [Angustibacter aerolatus]
MLPTFGDLGVEVVDERPYALDLPDGRTLHVYDFGLRYRGAGGWTGEHPERTRAMFQDAFAAVWSGRAESDGLNGLVLAAALDWRQVALLRALTKYLRQTGLTFSQEYVESCLLANASVARLLVQPVRGALRPRPLRRRRARTGAHRGSATCWSSRSAPRWTTSRASTTTASCGRCSASSARRCAPTGSSGAPTAARTRTPASRLDPHAVPDLPAPRPAYEVWVHSPRVEGCTCASARSPAAGCAGATGARTSAPRCSAWSRRRW